MVYFYQYKTLCQTCDRRLGYLRNDFLRLKNQGKSEQEILDDFGFNDDCCRASFMSGTTKFHDMEREEVVNGEFPAGDGPSFLSKDKISISKIKKSNSKLSSKSSVPIVWEDSEYEKVKEKSFLKQNIIKKERKKKKKDEFEELPSLTKIEDSDEEGLEYENIEEENDDDTNKVIRIKEKPTTAGFPVVYNSKNIHTNDTMMEITVGFIEKGGERIEMKTKVLNNLFYLAE